LRPIYTFSKATHIFDEEDFISPLVSDFQIMDGVSELKNYSFIDSSSNSLVQLSDVVVGLMGKLGFYLNSTDRAQIHSDFQALNKKQAANIDLLFELIDRSHDKNMAFLHSVDSY